MCFQVHQLWIGEFCVQECYMCDSKFTSYGLVSSVFRSVTCVIPSSPAMDWCVLCSGVLHV